MKRTGTLPALLCALSLLLTACSGPKAAGAETPYSPGEIAEVILDTQPREPALYALTPESADFDGYIAQRYGLDADTVEDGVVAYAGGVEAAEVAVLLFRDEAGAEALSAYLPARAGDFAGYAPGQAALAEGGAAEARGRYAALLIAADTDAARAAFFACFGEAVPALPEVSRLLTPEEDAAEVFYPDTPPDSGAPVSPAAESPAPDVYDPDAIIAAHKRGDAVGLSEKNRVIYERCVAVLEAEVAESMTDYEKELSIHDWIVRNADYDPGALSSAPGAAGDPDNENPYGLLVRGVAICSGYSSTFQLFMDLLGIECITVPGTAYSGAEEHAWNMVRLDGEWYCVDVTWDDPVGGGRTVFHSFFNVTSQLLRDTSHQWDEAAFPEATATAHAYGS